MEVSPGVTKVITKQGSGGTPKKGATISVHCTGSVLESSGTKKKFWRYMIVNPNYFFISIVLLLLCLFCCTVQGIPDKTCSLSALERVKSLPVSLIDGFMIMIIIIV